MNKVFTVGILFVSGILYYFQLSSSPNSILSNFEQNTILEISLKKTAVVAENGIGSDWFFKSEVDGMEISYREKIEIDASGKSSILIKSSATEWDESYPDNGTSKFYITPENLQEVLSDGYIYETVKVKEYHGRSAGNTAICSFTYLINKKDN